MPAAGRRSTGFLLLIPPRNIVRVLMRDVNTNRLSEADCQALQSPHVLKRRANEALILDMLVLKKM